MKKIFLTLNVSIAILILISPLIGGMITGCISNNYNYSLEPSEPSYTGEWIVYTRGSKMPFLKVQYHQGIKDGKEVSWYRYPDIIMAEQIYNKGVLNGISKRYDGTSSNIPILEGEFRSGKPWDGTFLINECGDVLTSTVISFGMNDVVMFAARYKDGSEIERGYIGPKGLVPFQPK